MAGQTKSDPVTAVTVAETIEHVRAARRLLALLSPGDAGDADLAIIQDHLCRAIAQVQALREMAA